MRDYLKSVCKLKKRIFNKRRRNIVEVGHMHTHTCTRTHTHTHTQCWNLV